MLGKITHGTELNASQMPGDCPGGGGMGGFGIDWYIMGQRHDRVQTESQIATVDSCFDLVGSRPAARCSKL